MAKEKEQKAISPAPTKAQQEIIDIFMEVISSLPDEEEARNELAKFVPDMNIGGATLVFLEKAITDRFPRTGEFVPKEISFPLQQVAFN